MGLSEIDSIMHDVNDGNGMIILCGTMHNVTKTSKTATLKLYTIYSPPEHRDSILRKTNQEVLPKEEDFHGRTTEEISV
jgi:mannose-6-phosphate isomerase-like protein (cupin superfamily)